MKDRNKIGGRAPPQTPASIDPISLAQALLRCASITPSDDGAQEILASSLSSLGFTITRLRFGHTDNLFARLGDQRPHFCFAGHTDVVPPGDSWQHDPFGGTLVDGILYGRGACDMKGAIAAFVTAVEQRLRDGTPSGSISLLITGDEEGPATDGTVRVLDWMAEHGQIPDWCLVGEPTSQAVLGDTVKVGRRGSFNATLIVHGTAGHVAYPHRADNPVHRLIAILAEMTAATLDQGTDRFEPSSLQITSIDVGNPTGNVIPAEASARLNIRFNPHYTGASLETWLRAIIARHAEHFDLDIAVSGEAFLTPGDFAERLARVIAATTGVPPVQNTGGGTSDARFVHRFCPVAEFGLVGATMHKPDEAVSVADLHDLTTIYAAVLAEFVPMQPRP